MTYVLRVDHFIATHKHNMMSRNIPFRILYDIFIISYLLSIRLAQVFLFFTTKFGFVDERRFRINLNILNTARWTINCVFVEFTFIEIVLLLSASGIRNLRSPKVGQTCFCNNKRRWKRLLWIGHNPFGCRVTRRFDCHWYECEHSCLFCCTYKPINRYINQSCRFPFSTNTIYSMPPRAIQSHLFHPYIVRTIPWINSDSSRNQATDSSTQDTHNVYPEPSVFVSPYDAIESEIKYVSRSCLYCGQRRTEMDNMHDTVAHLHIICTFRSRKCKKSNSIRLNAENVFWILLFFCCRLLLCGHIKSRGKCAAFRITEKWMWKFLCGSTGVLDDVK